MQAITPTLPGGVSIHEMDQVIARTLHRFDAFENTEMRGLPFMPASCDLRLWKKCEVEEFVGSHVAHIQGTKLYVMKVFCPMRHSYTFKLVSKEELSISLSGYSFPQPPERVGKGTRALPPINGTEVLRSSAIPKYMGILFDPSNPDPRTGEQAAHATGMYRMYNPFRGLPIKFNPQYPLNFDLTGPFNRHGLEILCNGRTDEYEYLRMWVAHMFQHPKSKPGTALLFQSEQGAGKNVWWQAIMDILSPEYCAYVIHKEHIAGKFNQHLANKLLVVCDEVVWGGSHELNNIMKARITQATMMLEKKGCDAVNIDCYERYVMLSNEEWPVRIEQSCRRYACFRASSARIGDHHYFDFLVSHIKQPAVLEAIYHEFMAIQNVPSTMPRPIENDVKQTLRGISRSDEAQFLRDLLDHQNGCENMTFVQDNAYVTSSGLFQLYQEWHRLNARDRNMPSLRSFGIAIKKILGERKCVRSANMTRWDSHPPVASDNVPCYCLNRSAVYKH